MGMIKRADLERHTRDAYVMDLRDLERRGSALVEAANSKAAQIISDAHNERESLIGTASQEGHSQGYTEGHAAGFAKGHEDGVKQAQAEHAQQLDLLLAAWSEQLELFERQRDSMLELARVQVVELAAAIAQRVVHRAVELDPAVVLQEVESVLSSVTESTRLVLSVHPDDAELVNTELPALIDRFASCEHAQVVTDPALPRGSCIARTPGGGVLDASISTQLDRIVSALLPSGHPKDGALGISCEAEEGQREDSEHRGDDVQEDAA